MRWGNTLSTRNPSASPLYGFNLLDHTQPQTASLFWGFFVSLPVMPTIRVDLLDRSLGTSKDKNPRMANFKWLLMMLLMTSCTLAGGNPTAEPLVTATPIIAGKPEVTIESPDTGDEITLGTDVLVSATAIDEGGVTRVQLFANDTLVKTVSSQEPTGDQNLPVVLDYQPRNAGELTLEVLAYRGTVASDPAIVTITVLEEQSTIQAPIDTNAGPVINPNDPTCRVLTNVNLNYRTGPSVDYRRLGTLAAGTQAPIVGRLGDNTWWYVQVNPSTQAWLSADFTSEYGNCINIPIVAPPPTPTGTAPTPTPTTTPTHTPEPTATATGVPLPPDLIVTTIEGPKTLTLSGDSVQAEYSVVITNAGGSSAGQFSNEIRYLPGGEVIDLGVVSGLDSGESVVLSATVTFTNVGEFSLQVTVDNEDTVEEINDLNTTALVINVSEAS